MTELEIHKGFIQDNIDSLNNKENGGRQVAQLSDGYHTFDELYEFRKMYNAALFNEWALNWNLYNQGILGCNIPITGGKYNVHKSWIHMRLGNSMYDFQYIPKNT